MNKKEYIEMIQEIGKYLIHNKNQRADIYSKKINSGDVVVIRFTYGENIEISIKIKQKEDNKRESRG